MLFLTNQHRKQPAGGIDLARKKLGLTMEDPEARADREVDPIHPLSARLELSDPDENRAGP